MAGLYGNTRVAGADTGLTVGNSAAQQLAKTVQAAAAAKAAAAQPATPPQGGTGFWSRIAQVGIGKVTVLNTLKAGKAVGEGIAKPIARVLPGGQNDLKAENDAIDQNNQQRQQANKMVQSGDPKQVAAGKKLLQMNQKNTQQTSADVSKTNADINHDVSGIKTFGKGVKSVGKSLVAGEQAVATPIARLLPGGQNDLKAENEQIDQNIKLSQKISQLSQSTNPKDQATAKVLAKLNKQNIVDTSKTVEQTTKDIKNATDKGHIAAGMASTVLDILTAGGGTLAKEGAKYTAEKGVAKVAAGKLTKEIPEALKVGGKKTQAAIVAGSSGAAGVANAKANGATEKQAIEQGLVGAAIPLVSHFGSVKNAFQAGSKAALNKIRGVAPTVDRGVAQADVLTAEQANKAAAAAHTKVNVSDQSSGSSGVPVNTPVRPGVKQVSETSKINVRTPQKMTDDQFHKEFTSLSKNYEKESAALQKDVSANAASKEKLPTIDANADVAKPTTQAAKISKAAHPDQPTIDGYNHSTELEKDHADMMKGIEDSATGGQKVKTEDGYVRTSEHGKFYRDYYAENGRAPSKAAYMEQAKKELASGKAPYGMSDTYKALKEREANPAKPYDPKTDSKPAAGVTDPKLTVRQQVAARQLDAKYEAALNDLHDRYHHPELSAPKAPKTVARETLPAGKTTGGRITATETKASRPTVQTITQKAKRETPPTVTAPKPDGTATVSGSSTKIEAEAIKKGLTQRMEDLPEFASVNKAEQARKVTDLINNDRQKAIDIIDGKANPPDGIHPVAVHNGLVQLARKEGDGELMTKLAQSNINRELSKSGQSLSLAAERDPHDPVEAIRQVSAARQQALERRGGSVAKNVSKITKEIDSKIKVPSKGEWQIFLESIKC